MIPEDGMFKKIGTAVFIILLFVLAGAMQNFTKENREMAQKVDDIAARVEQAEAELADKEALVESLQQRLDELNAKKEAH